MKNEKGSIAIFTLVTLLFMIGFLIISYANIINNSKTLKEQYSTIKGIYYKSNDSSSYTDIYTDLRKKNRQNLTAYVDNSNILELEKTFASKLINYRIYGNTVDGVNLFNINSVTEFYDKNDKTLTGSCRKEGNIIISDRGNSMDTSCYFNSNIKSLPAGTYTISVDVMIDNDDANKKVALGYKVNSTTRNTKYITLNSYKMWERVQWTFSLDSETTITGIQLQALGDSTNYRDLNVKFKNIQLEKGSTATDYIPCEIKSVGDLITDINDVNYGKYKIPIKVSGKNLFNKETATLGKNLDATTGTFYNSAARCVSDYIEVNSSKQYTFVYNPDFAATRYLCCYDKDKNYIGQNTAYKILTGKSNTTMTISFLLSEVKYIRANCFWNTDGTASEIDNFIIYEGSGDDTYEPYVEPVVTNIYLDEPLRKAGDYADYIDSRKQCIVRNAGINSTGDIYSLNESVYGNLTLPELPTYEDYTKIEIGTEVAPSKIEVEYDGYVI